MNWLRWLVGRGGGAGRFAFRDPGILEDGDLRLVLRATESGRPAAGVAPSYEFEMRSADGPGRWLGRISLRIGDTPRLRLYVGHVGYFVDPEHRGRRYAARAVRLVLPLAWRHGVDPVWITCNPDNAPAGEAVPLAGGEYVETVPVPPEEPLHLQGDLEKCRFRFVRPA